MREHEKPRDTASEAVIALRNAMRLTQQRLAVEVVKCAIGTISRWETSDPPRGDALKQLTDIAEEQRRLAKTPDEQQEFIRIRDTFTACYYDDAKKKFAADLVMFPKTRGKRAFGYLFKRLEGPDALRGANYFLDILSALQSKDPDARQEALTGMKRLAQKLNKEDPQAADMREHIRESMLSAIS